MLKKNTDEVKLAVMANDISYIKNEVTEISKKMQEDYVTKIEFEPIKRIVYGLIGLILIAVAGGILALVLK